MDDTPIESRKGESKKNWIWVTIGLVILIALVVWAVSRGLRTDAATSDPEVGRGNGTHVEETVRMVSVPGASAQYSA